MKSLVFSSFPDEVSADAAALVLASAGFDIIDAPVIRSQCADFGVRVARHVVGVSTNRPTAAGQVLRDLDAPRVRTVPHVSASGNDRERVNQAGHESFPASDPPAWTG